MNTQTVLDRYGKHVLSTKNFDHILSDIARNVVRKLRLHPSGIDPKLFVVESATDEEVEKMAVKMITMSIEKEMARGSEGDRDLFLLLLGSSFVSRRIIPSALYLVSEAWIKDIKGKDSVGKVDDKVREVIIVAGLTIDGRANLIEIPVRRNKDGDIFKMNSVGIHFTSEMPAKNDSILEEIFKGFTTAVEATTTSQLLQKLKKDTDQ